MQTEDLRQVFERENFRKRCCCSSKFAWSLAPAIRLHLRNLKIVKSTADAFVLEEVYLVCKQKT